MVQDGGNSRLIDLFREWRLPLKRFLSRRNMAPSADIDDISQEVFLRLLRYERSELVDQPQAYLFKIASNVSSEWRMRSNRRLPHDSAWLSDLVDTLSPESELEAEDVTGQLEAAVLNLPERAREILRLRFTDGMTYAQVAATMGVSLKVVSRDVERAYAAIRLFMLRRVRVAGEEAGEQP